LKVLRDKSEKSFDVTLDEIPTERLATPTVPPKAPVKAPTKFGIALGESREGVVVERVESGSKAEEVLRRGDVILEINKTAVATPQAAAKALEGAQSPILAKVRRGNVTRWVAIEK
jgi:S1-C subfamily serine protease